MKSREIWIWDYFANLQLEFLSYYARYLLYSREDDRKKFSDICKMKQRKILKLALRLDAKSIFSDCETWDKHVLKWMNDGYGVPKFSYSGDKQKEMYVNFDNYFYFPDGSWITYKNKAYQIIKNLVITRELLIKSKRLTRRITHDEAMGQGFQIMSMTEDQINRLKAGDYGKANS